MCVGFKKVQSDDPQSPDSLCNTFTEAGEEGENPAPLPHSAGYPPLSPHSLWVRNEPSEREMPGCCLPGAQPGCTLESLLLWPLIQASAPRDARLPPTSCGTWEAGANSPAHCPPASASEKSPIHMHLVIKIKSGNCFFQKKGMKLSFKWKLN